MSYLNTQILRNGEPIKVRWGHWTLDAVCEAAQQFEEGCDFSVLPPDGFIFEHDFAVCDPTDREEFFIYKGDQFHTWWSYY